MASLLSSFSGMAQTTVVPMIFKFIETQEPMLQEALVSQLNNLKQSNPNQFNIFLTNWRKINNAIERSSQIPAAPPVAPPVAPPTPPATGGTAMGVVPETSNEDPTVPLPPVLEETDKAGTRKRRRHKKRTHKVKHRKH